MKLDLIKIAKKAKKTRIRSSRRLTRSKKDLDYALWNIMVDVHTDWIKKIQKTKTKKVLED